MLLRVCIGALSCEQRYLGSTWMSGGRFVIFSEMKDGQGMEALIDLIQSLSDYGRTPLPPWDPKCRGPFFCARPS